MSGFLDVADTIVAIASPVGPAMRGIVRMSGPNTIDVLSRAGIPTGDRRRAHHFESPIDLGDPIGSVPTQVLVWPTTRSYTGAPSVELHTIGSLPILTRISERLVESGGRPARPGEFTMRAFLAGRLDLTQAEAVLGVIDAERRGDLDHALQQLAGNLSRPLESIRGALLDLLADVEAGLDFVDEDIQFVSDEVLVDRLTGLSGELAETSRRIQSRGGGRSLVTIAIRGEPNAGKSCLINRLAGRPIAIVADVAGTTRDTVTAQVSLAGHDVLLVDTAGIETAGTHVSIASQAQAERADQSATIRLWCVDSTRVDFGQACRRVIDQASLDRKASQLDLFLATKSDLVAKANLPDGWLRCSPLSGDGIDAVVAAVGESLQDRDAQEVGSVVGTAMRCSASLADAQRAIDQAIAWTDSGDGHEFVSSELRMAAEALGEVTGAVYTDDILDRVFGRFCIGK